MPIEQLILSYLVAISFGTVLGSADKEGGWFVLFGFTTFIFGIVAITLACTREGGLF